VKQLLAEVFAFHAWARARVLAAANQLPYEALRRPVLIPGGNEDGSVHATLAHLAATQAHWLARFQGQADHELSGSAAFTDLRSIAHTWEQADAAMLELIAATDLERIVHYQRAVGEDEQPLWQLLLHVSNHTTHHRAEACAALTALGSPPESVDFIDFIRQKKNPKG
jgi:uncharacterized damage-inducible protein DinB